MVKPGGTGRPRLAISARLAPLPPRRSRSPALPSALPSPKVNTHWPDLTPAGFAAGFAGFRASCETRFPALQVQPFQHAKSDQADADQIDRDDQVEQPRHDQDQD